MANGNPILKEMLRIAEQGNVVGGIQPAEGNKPPTYRIECRLKDGGTAAFYVEARSDRQFDEWFNEAFQSLVKTKSPHRSPR